MSKKDKDGERLERTNPVIELNDISVHEREGPELLGNTMFWKYYEDINPKYVFKCSTIEYRSLKLMLFETIFYVMLLGVLTGYIDACRGSMTYYTTKAGRDFWRICDANSVCAIDEVNDEASFWQFIRQQFIPLTFSDRQEYEPVLDLAVDWESGVVKYGAKANTIYELNEMSVVWHPRYIGDSKTNILLGNVRLRQLRMRNKTDCIIGEVFQQVTNECFGPFSADKQSRKSYDERWTPTQVEHCYTWHPSNITDQVDVYGSGGLYPGDGFVMDVPLSLAEADSQLSDLQTWHWIDQATRAVIVELNTLNPNVNMITNIRLLFEFLPSGQIRATTNVFAFRTIWLSLSVMMDDDLPLFVYHVAIVALFSVWSSYVFWTIKKTGPLTWFSYMWNVVDLAGILLFATLCIIRVVTFVSAGQEPTMQPELAAVTELFVPYSKLVPDLQRADDVMAFLGLFCWLKAFKYFSLSHFFGPLVRVTERGLQQLAKFGTLLCSLFLGFAICLHIGFGAQVETYDTLGGSFLALFFMLSGSVDLGVLFDTHNALATALFAIYVVLIYFVLFNLFMAVILDVHMLVQIEQAGSGQGAKAGEARKNPMLLFLFTYWHKLKGIVLIGNEPEAAVGFPDEQFINLNLLPGIVRGRLMQKIDNAIGTLEELEGPAAAVRQGGQLQTVETLKQKWWSGEGEGEEYVSRVQLQRCLDQDADLRELLGMERAIDVIRRFRVDQGPDPYDQISRLQDAVFSKLDLLEKDDGVKFEEAETLKMVAVGLSEALTDVQNAWREELTNCLESAATLSEGLIQLTKRLERVQLNFNKIESDVSNQYGK